MDAASIARSVKGTKAGSGWLVRCPAPGHTDTEPSCSVRDGIRGPVFHCFAGCDWREVRAGAVTKGWIADPRNELPVDPETARKRLVDAHEATCFRRRQEKAEEARRVALAQRIWSNTVDGHGSPADVYLRSRRITIRPPAALRFSPSVWHPYERATLPAMVAAIEHPVTGELQGVHVTYLRPDGRGKADVSPAKLMRGRAGGGVVRLAPVSQHMALAEGIESALSHQQLTGIPTWGALSAGNFEKVRWPAIVKRVTVAADNDARGLAEAEKAARRWAFEGLTVEVSKPSTPGADFNDILVTKGKRAA